MIVINGYKNIKDKIKEETCVTVGNFDGLHLGHQEILQALFEKKNKTNLKSIIYTFNVNPKVILNKNKMLVNFLTPIEEKLKIFKKFDPDFVIIENFTKELSKNDARFFIEEILQKKLKTKYIIEGFDFRFGFNREGNNEVLKKYFQDNLKIIDAIKINDEKISSSLIRKKLEEGRVDEIPKYLGRYYKISGEVIHGVKLGREMKIPTANIDYGAYFLPKIGIYQMEIIYNNKKYKGAGYVGTRPTFSRAKLCLEVYILDFLENIYGETLDCYFVKYLREEIKFKNVNELKRKIEEDIELVGNKNSQ